VAVLGGKALPVVEILPRKAEFYDYASKYDEGGSEHLCPAPLSRALTRQAQALGLGAHEALGCKGYSRTDMMLDKRGKLWILELNSLPGMTPLSLLPDAARAAGISYPRLLKMMAAGA
jgi:D-alanine-D-alanine ligase